MSQVVYKYQLSAEKIQTFKVCVGSRPLTVQLQNNNPVLWVLTHAETAEEYFKELEIPIVATGEEFDAENYEYISTFHINGLVFHVFFNLDFI